MSGGPDDRLPIRAEDPEIGPGNGMALCQRIRTGMAGTVSWTFPVFHWHEETFDLPAGATLIAEGDAVKNQAFRIGSAVGVQFHPEVTAEMISF